MRIISDQGPVIGDQEYKTGVLEEWVPVLRRLGYTNIEKLKAVKKPGKLHYEMMGYRKKSKLEIRTATLDDVCGWLAK